MSTKLFINLTPQTVFCSLIKICKFAFPEPLQVSDVVRPIGMASAEPEVGAICEMAGWGKLEGGILEG